VPEVAPQGARLRRRRAVPSRLLRRIGTGMLWRSGWHRACRLPDKATVLRRPGAARLGRAWSRRSTALTSFRRALEWPTCTLTRWSMPFCLDRPSGATGFDMVCPNRGAGRGLLATL